MILLANCNICVNFAMNFLANPSFFVMHFTYRFPYILQFLFAFVLAFVVVPGSVSAQDLIARQAPVDRRVRAIDSVAISRVLNRRKVVDYESDELYTSWNTESVHCYADSQLPEKFRIDLRGFAMPTPSRVVTSNFGYRPAFGRNHKGIDVKVYIGDTIVSAFDGKVRVVKYDRGGYGKYIVVRHGNGLETIYGHLSKQLVKVGDVVRAGEPIGLGGNTGLSTGSHLHFETRLLGQAINPALLFDFANQDVTCDFYDYYNPNYNPLRRNAESAPALAQLSEGNDAGESVGQAETGQMEKPQETVSVSKKSQGQGKGKVYKVRKGDSLYSISQRTGVSVRDLCRRNNISKRAKLQLGQILKY